MYVYISVYTHTRVPGPSGFAYVLDGALCRRHKAQGLVIWLASRRASRVVTTGLGP